MTDLAAVDELVAGVEAALRDAEEALHGATGARHAVSMRLSAEDALICRQQLRLLARLRELLEAEADDAPAEQAAA